MKKVNLLKYSIQYQEHDGGIQRYSNGFSVDGRVGGHRWHWGRESEEKGKRNKGGDITCDVHILYLLTDFSLVTKIMKCIVSLITLICQ